MAAGLQVHGGIGFTWEHDMHLYVKRAQLDQVSFGDAAFHRDRIATHAPGRAWPAGTGSASQRWELRGDGGGRLPVDLQERGSVSLVDAAGGRLPAAEPLAGARPP